MQNGSSRGPREDRLLPNSKTQMDSGRTALHDAACAGDEKALEALLVSGADRNAKDSRHGNTALHEAAWRGYSRCVKALCALPKLKTPKESSRQVKGVIQETRGALHSALLGTRNFGGFSALHLAAQNGHNQSCREILLSGGNADVQNNYGDTPLHTACRYGHAGATRILLSAKCDLQRVNLNGDTALHISCAMGRRKLTRILMEAGCKQDQKNGQHETPRDIVLRKGLSEILDILNAPPKKTERDQSSGSSKKEPKREKSREKVKKGDRVDAQQPDPKHWSPYGCHYFPDPRSFPSPKLETLPKEPLAKGEQYYLDLAGNIRKGPIGVGNTCYCGPFFRHIEEKITKNRKSIRKYVDRATEKLDSKVTALAMRTEDQIGELTRSMIADRIRCEGRRLHLEQWLKRGAVGRSTMNERHHTSKSRKDEANNTLTRCRSLELLDDTVDGRLKSSQSALSRSVDLLDTQVEVHRSDVASSVATKEASRRSSNHSCSTSKNEGAEAMNVSERLEELLTKTHEIIEMERATRRRNRELMKMFPHSRKKSRMRMGTSGDLDDSQYIAEEMEKITASLMNQMMEKEEAEVAPVSPEIAKEVQHGKEKDAATRSRSRMSDSGSSVYVPDFNQRVRHPGSPGDKQTPPPPMVNGFYENACFEDHNTSSSNTIKSDKNTLTDDSLAQSADKVSIEVSGSVSEEKADEMVSELTNMKELHELKSRILNGSHWRSQVLRKSAHDHNRQESEQTDAVAQVENSMPTKYEIKNSEIKTLKTQPKSKVHELVAKIQGKMTRLKAQVKEEESESSDEDSADPQEEDVAPQSHDSYYPTNQMNGYTQHIEESLLPLTYHRAQPQVANYRSGLSHSSQANGCLPNGQTTWMANGQAFDRSALIPKDAYFHDLPHKNRYNPPADEMITSFCDSRNRNPLPYHVNDFLVQPEYDQPVIPQREKLLSARKFGYTNLVEMEQQMMEQAQLEREMNNDSGYSTKICGSSHGPSPSLSGQTDSDLGGTRGRPYNVGASSLV
ncbi:ankyrin repeat domain-containing protein 6 isoform X2 [Phlebotomus argentipes]|uniref:ankyrin repeat domain-containing protein 6 isoform X2 n=1 Tax=Phlebotomus argentipes TaxID=94469 RepID=UPI002892E0E4|nr:ankyrin repeat domain-containing protein 6 isoform X2 [Phlebotomus argentipes]